MAEIRLERYKVLGAAHALKEFTVADIERYSRVSEDTIHKVLSRDKGFFERVGQKSTTGRGRPSQVRRVAPAKAEALRSLLAELHGQLRELSAPVTASGGNSASQSSPHLAACLHTLLFEYPEAKNHERKVAVFQRAFSDRKKAQELSGTSYQTALGEVVDAMLTLTGVTLTLERCEGSRLRPAVAAPSLTHAIGRIVRAVHFLAEDEAEAVGHWLANHPLTGTAVVRPYFTAPARRSELVLDYHLAKDDSAIAIDRLATEQRETLAALVDPLLPAPDWLFVLSEIPRKIDLVPVGSSDAAVRRMADRLHKEILAGYPTRGPSVSVHRLDPDTYLRESRENVDDTLCLVACNSESLADQSLWWTKQFVALPGQVFVLDLCSKPDFMREVLACGARYVPHAAVLDRTTLFRAVTPLNSLLQVGETLNAVTYEEFACPRVDTVRLSDESDGR